MRFRFFRSTEIPVPAAKTGDDPVLADVEGKRVEPLIDAHHLSALALRRELLDWRDDAHTDITLTAKALHYELMNYFDKKLEEKGLIGRMLKELFAGPASKILRKETIQRIENPMHPCLYRLEATLAMIIKKGAHRRPLQLSFDRKRLETMDVFLSKLQIKSSARDDVAKKLNDWLLGPGGLAAELRDQATRMSNQLMQKSQK